MTTNLTIKNCEKENLEHMCEHCNKKIKRYKPANHARGR